MGFSDSWWEFLGFFIFCFWVLVVFLWGRREEENDDFDFGKFGDRVEFVEGKGSLKCGWVLIVDKPKTLLG